MVEIGEYESEYRGVPLKGTAYLDTSDGNTVRRVEVYAHRAGDEDARIAEAWRQVVVERGGFASRLLWSLLNTEVHFDPEPAEETVEKALDDLKDRVDQVLEEGDAAERGFKKWDGENTADTEE